LANDDLRLSTAGLMQSGASCVARSNLRAHRHRVPIGTALPTVSRSV